MNNAKIKILALVAYASVVTTFCGCGDSNADSSRRPTGCEGTQTVVAAVAPALPTGTVAAVAPALPTGTAAAASAALPTGAVASAEKPKQPVEPEINGIAMNGLRTITVKASDTPDLEEFLNYVKIVPNPGPITIDYYNWN